MTPSTRPLVAPGQQDILLGPRCAAGRLFPLFQAAICALEQRGIRRREWTHKGVHSDFVQLFVRRRKLVPASFAGVLPSVLHLRHMADYRQPGVSQSQAERAVRRAREFMTLLQREVFGGPQTDNS